MKAGRVESFATCYTGEMNALIRDHSSVGALSKSAPDYHRIDAFELGVHCARTQACAGRLAARLRGQHVSRSAQRDAGGE